MKNRLLAVVLLGAAAQLLSAGAVSAADTNSPALLKIGTADAAKHTDETLVVTGQVVQVTFRPKIVFLNLDRPYPNSPFSATIFADATNQFGDLKALKGKAVELSGKIKIYRDRPEMVLSKSNQLTIVTSSAATPAP
jgi:hypothetical protein